MVETAQEDVIVFCSFAEENKRRALEARGVRVEQVAIEAAEAGLALSPHEGRPDLYRVVSLLGAEGITSLLVEGGAVVNWAFLRSLLVDKLTLFFTPQIFGPVGAVPWLDGMSSLPAGDALHPSHLHLERHGEDFSVEAYLRDPYRTLGPEG